MRTPLAADVLLLARALMPLPSARRMPYARRLIREATEAQMHFEATRRCHPTYGDGSLMARVLYLRPVAEPVASDPDFLDAICIAAQALRTHYRARLPTSQL
ncbi:MAG: hypothetical protein U1E69_15600 [Tabrizicola sp.]|uniref:DUF7742 family protein n=1 Tax=Tabrizicola sp. TaxID=2005166 RepID=UPI002732BF28|nr:hypothetical protein [Tabrizicola sp.]MDP3264177.1 hypothetical protein [Tabrizicola sp.]MDP3649432.1 hypothetical protein [Paracoccaceae bacterium]MDZ4088213.1 hypothetical protein [Tabrizicola sp.]